MATAPTAAPRVKRIREFCAKRVARGHISQARLRRKSLPEYADGSRDPPKWFERFALAGDQKEFYLEIAGM
jgi:hypothetical protein